VARCVLKRKVRVGDVSCGPSQDAVAGLFFGFGRVVLFGPWERHHEGGAFGPEVLGRGPSLDFIEPARIGGQSFATGAADLICNGPSVELRDPGGDERPCRAIWSDAGLSEEFSGGYAGFVDVGLPQCVCQPQTFIRCMCFAPVFGQIIEDQIGDAQIRAVDLVIGGHFDRIDWVCVRLENL